MGFDALFLKILPRASFKYPSRLPFTFYSMYLFDSLSKYGRTDIVEFENRLSPRHSRFVSRTVPEAILIGTKFLKTNPCLVVSRLRTYFISARKESS